MRYPGFLLNESDISLILTLFRTEQDAHGTGSFRVAHIGPTSSKEHGCNLDPLGSNGPNFGPTCPQLRPKLHIGSRGTLPAQCEIVVSMSR